MHPLAQANTQPLPVPQVDWRAIAPELALLVAGVVLLLVVAFRPGAGRGLLAGLTLAGLVVAGALTAWNWDLERVAFEGAVYLLWAYQRMWQGRLEREENRAMGDLTGREWAILAPLVAAIIVLGLFPRPVLDRVEPSARRVVEQTQASSP